MKHVSRAAVVTVLGMMVVLAPGPAMAQADCAGLAGLKIPASAIHLPTSGGQVTSTSSKTSGVPYCEANASLYPVDPSAPDIQMRVALPDTWRGETVMFGGGGYNGSIPNVTGAVPFGAGATPLARGMVVYAGDSGHTASPTSLPSLDGSFGTNDEALRNFAGDALKKTHDATTFVIAAYYAGRRATRSYFAGGSTGGREALAVAQRWPADFDGVISVYPAQNAATLDLFFGFMARKLAQPGAFPDVAQQKLLYDSVMSACDKLDGAVDGIISNERDCHFEPATLRCPNGADLQAGCLTDAQIDAVRAIASPLSFGYRTASGETGYPGFPILSGADMRPVLLGFGTTPPANPMPPTAAYGAQFWDQWVRYFVTRDPLYDSLSLDPQAPGRWLPRINELTRLQDVNSPDLSAFAERGGKLLILHGSADELVSHRSTVEYYDRVLATMGHARTRSFSRFYLVPGANHANSGAAFSAAWDSLSALGAWVEDGRPPGDPVVTDASNGRTRPLCEYDAWPRYVGSGDVNRAGSFACVPAAGRPDATPAEPGEQPADTPGATQQSAAASATCTAAAPVARVVSVAVRRRALRLAGTATGASCRPAVAVQVAVARTAGRLCRFLDARGRPSARARPCDRRRYLPASKGVTSWHLRFRVAAGRYRISVRALDADGRSGAPAHKRVRIP